MKAYEIFKGSTSLEEMKIVELDQPSPGPGQVLVKVHATTVNYRDQAIVSGKYFGGVLQKNTIPLSDGAGEVVALGDNVQRFKKGDRVAATFFQTCINDIPNPMVHTALGSPLNGMLAEYVVLNQDGLVAIPDHLSFAQAACLPCAGVTAWNALMVTGNLQAGDTVLVLGTGGVSIFALQFAKMSGARVIVTSSSNDKLAKAKAMGADDTINYKDTPEWGEEVMRLTDGKGVNNVVEVGGSGTLSRSIQAVGMQGQISLIGVLSGQGGDTSPHGLMLKAARLQGVFVGNRAMFENLNTTLSINKVTPVIDKTFSFENAAQAFKHQLSGKHFGKIVITI